MYRLPIMYIIRAIFLADLVFFNYAAIPEIYTLSLHDALPISHSRFWPNLAIFVLEDDAQNGPDHVDSQDRKSTRLNSSHLGISYAVFCLKKKIRGRQLFVNECWTLSEQPPRRPILCTEKCAIW